MIPQLSLWIDLQNELVWQGENEHKGEIFQLFNSVCLLSYQGRRRRGSRFI